jgi:hypothetical protein
MVAATERAVPSVNSFTLPNTLTAVLLATRGACVAGASALGHTDRAVERRLAESPPTADSRRSLYGPPCHVGYHASRSMRPRIFANRLCVKWLPASWSLKYWAC